MLSIRILFCFLFLHLINGQLQINLHLTDWVNDDENHKDLQHDCLYVGATIEEERDPRQIISYCMSEWPSKWNIQENNFDQKFSFAELSKRKVTSQQLYLWSASMDVIEFYQFYIDQLSNSEKTSMETQFFYNCTLPNFGPKCQYVLHNYKLYHSSLDETVHDYYCNNAYESTTLTCYTHLQCNRGLSPSCLDWTEICDGKVDCLDGGHDEEHCWQLETHECDENEYRCLNGQCIPNEFVREYDNAFDCLDRSDEYSTPNFHAYRQQSDCIRQEPIFSYEDISCVKINNNYVTSLTSSCYPQRQRLLLQAMFSAKPKSISNECWTAFKCIIGMPISEDPLCKDLCFDGTCNEIVSKTCPDIIYAPAVPILLGHVFLAYEKNKLNYGFDEASEPIYVCYNNQLLHLPDDKKPLLLSSNNTCRFYKNTTLYQSNITSTWANTYIDPLYAWLKTWTSWIYNDSIICNKSSMYQCINSNKCISKSRLFDKVGDCFHNDDEEISMLDTNCSTINYTNYFTCKTTNKCIPQYFVDDTICHCTVNSDGHCDDEKWFSGLNPFKILFPTICDGISHISSTTIDSQNQNDETECDQWPCNNPYTHCDGYWNCLNGADELNCDSSPFLKCPPDNHICVSFETNELMCLPIAKVNDGKIDCIGAADERTVCNIPAYYQISKTFYCKNERCINPSQICDGIPDCTSKEDERACKSNDIINDSKFGGICTINYELYGSNVARVLCNLFLSSDGMGKTKYLKLGIIRNSSETNVIHRSSQPIQFYQQRCHRGLDLQVWLNKEKNITTNTCLCPPSFYGDICQFQNQRVSLTIQFRAPFDSIQIPFVIIISLIDDSEERIIHSSEQLTFLSEKHCQLKFNIYLVYSTRPKNQAKNYFVHIDIYEKTSLIYRGSIIKPLLFPFLPIQRLSFQLDIPDIYGTFESCSDRRCINGLCRRYFNDPTNTLFCQCNPGWSGRYCTIQHTCMCSSDSLCLGMLANKRSLCVCPTNKMGHRCLFHNPICQTDQDHKCLNGGECVTTNQYAIYDKQFICICPKSYTGERCEMAETKMIVSFQKDMVLPSSIFIHFIRIHPQSIHDRGTTFKMIPFGDDSTSIYWSLPFNIVFLELTKKNYYLIFIQIKYIQSAIIQTTVNPSNHCLHISELFNETILNYALIRRIKYYHIPCRHSIQHLSCFYDNIHLCICQDHQGERVANCFEFNHNLKMNCSGNNGCLNGGECFQDDVKCPQTSVCACPVCFYGTRCQFSTSGYSLSFDTILGYHIRPNINISHQPSAVLLSLILSVIITLGGLVNGIVSLITFKHKETRNIGCGIYLLWTSINSLLTMIIFTLKIWILIFSQMGTIQNRSFLYIQCISFDFLLRFCLTMDHWLTTCVAIERAYITIKGDSFSKKKVRLTAKIVIFGLILITIGTSIPDPINRRLLDKENKIWCIVSYSSSIYIVNLVMTIFQIIVPFIINLISTIIIVIMNFRQRAAIQNQQPDNKMSNEQFQQYKNLIGPIVLIILAIPHLIISFASGCIKSATTSWLFLLGYFISLIPPLLTFILFILPSTTYYQVFRKAMSQYRNTIRMRS